jgi:hypothetical protein
MNKILKFSLKFIIIISVFLIITNESEAQWVWQNPYPTSGYLNAISFINGRLQLLMVQVLVCIR